MGEALSEVRQTVPNRESEGPPHRIPGVNFCNDNRYLTSPAHRDKPSIERVIFSPLSRRPVLDRETLCSAMPTPSLKVTVFSRDRRNAFARHQNSHQVKWIGRRQHDCLSGFWVFSGSRVVTPLRPVGRTVLPKSHPQIARREFRRDPPGDGKPSAIRATWEDWFREPANHEKRVP